MIKMDSVFKVYALVYINKKSELLINGPLKVLWNF